MQQTKYLFTITISSVQNFIFQAIKTKDLFAGSQIVSDVIKEAIKLVLKIPDTEIIIPNDKDIVSNKIVFKIKHNKKDIKEFGKKLEENMREKLKKSIGDDSIFNIFWTTIELDEQNYQKSYMKLEQTLGMIKNARVFKQDAMISENMNKKKCEVCGERNQSKDKLCEVCFKKREYIKGYFPSIAEICLLNWLSGVDYSELKKEKDFDEEWFLEDKKREEVKLFLKKYESDLDTNKQPKHYALIQFDIDSLGKTLSNLSKEKQQDLSKKLADLSKDIKSFIDGDMDSEIKGKTIYAGGDDFLAFVNLKYFENVITKIYEVFKEKELPKIKMTFSMSIIIAHYKTPLHKVLDYSRKLLRESKNATIDKSNIGFMIMSSNSIISKTIVKKEELDILFKMQKEVIALNLYAKLQNLFYAGMSYDELLITKEIMKTEIKRVLKKEESFKNNNEDRKDIQKIINKINHVLDKQIKEISANCYKVDFDNFIGFLKSVEQLKKVDK